MSIPDNNVDQTIDRLVAEMRPVRRVWSPAKRSLVWIGLALTVMIGLIWRMGAMRGLAKEFTRATNTIELLAATATGVLALVAAFYLTMPDRSPRWAWLPVPTLVLWIGATCFACVQTAVDRGVAALFQKVGWPCFVFIAVVSIPLGIALLLVMRRGAPTEPVRTAMLGGLGVSALAAAALHAFHPFDGGLGDTGMHVVAILAIVAAFGALGRPALDRM
ncbi:NrsF family protein [Roseiterribacter gracilis]|uniref:DUF1109 domain-containing protein n=1 Tax=Roseiterribacter gracilis TaxID=2812848 RepID=A0A8S8XL96_9PROT|nr:hypothetical protein TMPK1_41020 [Rhodospirillales bacterium TMPK1]